jgi:hypothetical protein
LTSALVAMEGVSESDTDTDEIAREARGVVEAIRERWVFEEVVRVGGAEAWRKPWQ